MFWFMLAGYLGMSVKRCQQEIDSDEFANWLAWYRIDPFGEQRSDLRAGIIASATLAPYRKPGSKAAKPEDFMPFRPERKPELMTAAQLRAAMDRAFGRKG